MLLAQPVRATGEAATYFEIFVPPNNDPVNRHVALIVTAIYDSTQFQITDDGRDGDTDDSVSGLLMAGQSYILYIRDNAVNDDANAPGGSGAKQDGDFFVISTSNLVVAFQACNSDWQHDFVPATNKSSLGTRYIIYAPPPTSSPRDINVFAYEDATQVTIRKISTTPKSTTGYTQVNTALNNIVVQRTLQVGQDIIHYHTEGRNLLETGATYILESNKPVSVQCGALFGNERDGGAYVPSGNGSSAGELFYFAVPVQAVGEQEIRVVSWDDNNTVQLDYYQGGNWIPLQTWNLNALKPGEWISKSSSNKSAVFRVTCTPGKKVSVFEANWLETGSPGTSDIGTMASAESGTSAGKRFLVYMSPPGNEDRVTNPFTGLKFTQATHAFIFSRKNATVTVKDANTNGGTINRTYNVPAGYYVDCFLTLDEWRSIYNGTGTTAGGSQRPYLTIESDVAISVFVTNFNDNWMAYFGTSQTQDFGVNIEINDPVATPGDTLTITSELVLSGTVTQPVVEIVVGNGATVTSSTLTNQTTDTQTPGNIAPNPNTGTTVVTFAPQDSLNGSHEYTTETNIVLNNNFNNGDLIPNNTVIAVETVVSGEIEGVYQQASTATGVINTTANRPPPMFFRKQDGTAIVDDNASNLSVSFGDYTNDGRQDLIIPGYQSGSPNLLYINKTSRNFDLVTSGDLAAAWGAAATGTWGDYDNDGDVDIFISYTGSSSNLFENKGNGTFERKDKVEPSRYTGSCFNASWVDYNRDGLLDLFVSEYIANRPNLLYRNLGNGEFRRLPDSTLVGNANSIGATWCDYDGDGWQDLFVPNDNGTDNYLFRNILGTRFERIATGAIVSDGGSSVGSSWGDYDNDRDFDLFVTNTNREPHFLYQNNGDGTFNRVTAGAIANTKARAQGSAWGDLDNDGDLDLVVTCGDESTHFLYFNNGDGSFTMNTDEELTRMRGFLAGVAMADLENDGDLDIVAANHLQNDNYVWVNNGNSNAWSEIKLIGSLSNRSAIGAVVEVKATIGGRAVWQTRHIAGQTGGGPGAQSALTVHVGLGTASRIDSLIIRWPSGTIQIETQQSVRQILVFQEEEGTLLTGRVYLDADSSCTYTEGEIGVPNQLVRINPGDLYALTDSAGKYAVRLSNGTYVISQQTGDLYDQACPPPGQPNHTVVIGANGGATTYAYKASAGTKDCTTGCTRRLTGTVSTAVTINSGERVCLEAGATITGDVTLRPGGELVICGDARSSNINIQGGNTPCRIIVSGTGTVNIPVVNLSNILTIINYGAITLTGQVNVNGRLENFGTITAGSMNINNGGGVLNSGTINLSSSLNNNDSLINYGTIAITGSFNNNGNAHWLNYCKLTATGDINQNGELINQGYIRSNATFSSNGGSDNLFRKGSRLSAANLTVNGDIEGPDQPGSSITVSGTTRVNGGAVISGYVDLCDDTGIETFNGTLGSNATDDCSGRISTEPCYSGSVGSGYQDYDFGNIPVCQEPNLAISVGTTGLRRGFQNDYVLQVSNNSAITATQVEVSLDLPRYAVPLKAVPAWTDSVQVGTGSRITWTIPVVGGMERLILTLTDSVEAITPQGVFVRAAARIGGSETECDPEDNSAVAEDEVVGSFDPNDKQVYPIGAGANHYILSSDTLYYKIRFQNVGTAEALRVVIRDTLSPFLNPASFVQGPMSHEGFVVIGEGGELVWTFNNINLPDSGSDEPGSHGFVQFKIVPYSSLPNESLIENSAAIYFDFNEPVITNTVFHTVTDRLTYEDDYLLILAMYPTPLVSGDGRITVFNLQEGIIPVPLTQVEIYNNTGLRVAILDGGGKSELIFPRGALPAGAYFMRGWDIHGFTYTGNLLLK
ncbi:MAG: FG-GAP-like repeat-containing protein [Bacteroidia bacterium]|nr:FG-GAP-like repeat-containing protein [Bacteroidia bacterium]